MEADAPRFIDKLFAGDKKSVLVDTLISELSSFLGQLHPIQVQLIKAIFSQETPPGAISRSQCILFFKRFGPLRLCLKKIADVLINGKDWFHGNADRVVSEKRLKSSRTRRFLIRYSSTNPGAFSICYLQDSRIMVFNGIENNPSGEGVSVVTNGERKTYNYLSIFIDENQQLFGEPGAAEPSDPFQQLKNELYSMYSKDASLAKVLGFATSDSNGSHKAVDEVEMAVKACIQQRNPALDLSGMNLGHGEYAEALPPIVANTAQFLMELDLSRNDLAVAPVSLKYLSNLDSLDLNNNMITKLPAVPSIGTALAKLTTLRAAHNRFDRFPLEFLSMNSIKKKLAVLDLSHNSLPSLPVTAFEGMSLEILDLSHNQIQTLPLGIARLPRLEQLHLQNNNITRLPPELGMLEQLLVLDVSSNKIEEFPVELADLCESLEVLGLAGNPLKDAALHSIVLADQQSNTAQDPLEGGILRKRSSLARQVARYLKDKKGFRENTAMLRRGSAGESMNSSGGLMDSGSSQAMEERPQTIDEYLFLEKDRSRLMSNINTSQLLHQLLRASEDAAPVPTVQQVALASLGKRSRSLPTGLVAEDAEVTPRSKSRAALMSSTAHSLIVPSSEFTIERGSESARPYMKGMKLEADRSLDCSIYRQHFLETVHTNFIGVHHVDKNRERTIAISIHKEPVNSGTRQVYMALIRTPERDVMKEIPVEDVKKKKTDRYARSKELLALLKKMYTKDKDQAVSELLSKAKIRTIRVRKSHREFLKLENTLRLPRLFNIGVIYAENGQTSESEWYNNALGSASFYGFLDSIATRIRLKGWKKHSGGLDTQSDTTGSESYFCSFKEFEVMFHVSTLLPFTPSDKQQLERKRHIGNDVVNIIFKEVEKGKPSTPLPLVFSSHMTHVVFVVEIDHKADTPETAFYKVNVAYKGEEMTKCEPELPQGSSFPASELFKEFLLTKMINAERGSYAMGELHAANLRKRKVLLQEMEKKTFPPIKKKQEDTPQSYYQPDTAYMGQELLDLGM